MFSSGSFVFGIVLTKVMFSSGSFVFGIVLAAALVDLNLA